MKTINRGFAQLGVQKHPGKTFVGRISRGFDFPGLRYGEGLLGPAAKTALNFLQRCFRLYERKGHLPGWEVALESCCRRRWRWCTDASRSGDFKRPLRPLLHPLAAPARGVTTGQSPEGEEGYGCRFWDG